MDELSFESLFNNIDSIARRRDPRLARLASVAAALQELVGASPSPAKVFSTAIETLDGTLHKNYLDENALLDAMSTQRALLELVGLTVTKISPGTLALTVSHSSRTLRGAIHACISLDSQTSQSMLFSTRDGLDVTNTVLCSACITVSRLIRHLPHNADNKTVAELFRSTLLILLSDTRSKVKAVAVSEVCRLLAMDSPKCHGAIHIETAAFVNQRMNTSLKMLSERKSAEDFIDLLDFLRHSLIFLDFTAFGSRIMKLLVSLCEASVVSDGIRPGSMAGAKNTILTVNAILATTLAMLEHEAALLKKQKLCSFASRVLASLVQQQPTLMYRNGAADIEVVSSGRAVFGQVMLSSCQHLLLQGNEKERKTAMILLPLSVQHIVNLSIPLETLDGESAAFTLMPELSILFRQLAEIKQSAPQLHEKCARDCLAGMEPLLKSTFEITWEVSLKPLVLLISQMDPQNDCVRRCVKRLAVLGAGIPDRTMQRVAVESAISSLVQGYGLEILWKQLELSNAYHHEDEEMGAIVKNMVWLLQLMKSSDSVGAETELSLYFFQHTVLPLARFYDSLGADSTMDSLKQKRTVIALWALFPSFCRRPTDLESVFDGLAPLLVRAMNDERYPELVSIISSGLKTIANGVRKRKLENEELVDDESAVKIRREADVLEQVSEKLIPSLFKIVENIHTKEKAASRDMEVENSEEKNPDKSEKVRSLTDAIASLSQLAPQHLIERLYSKIIQKLLEAHQGDTQKSSQMDEQNSDEETQMVMLLHLAQALLASIDPSSITLLFRCLKPLIRSDETKPRVQKRAYKVLAEICQHRPDFVRQGDTLNDTLQLLTSSLHTSQVSSRFMRIKCLTLIVDSVDNPDETEKKQILGLLGETLLSLKDSNARTRDAALKLLLSIAEVQGDIVLVVTTVMAAVASSTAHMRSAAVIALSRILFEYSKDERLQSMLPALLKTVLVLSDDLSREVTKSFVSFIRVAVVVIPKEQLLPLLPDILQSLLSYHRGKDRFRSKIKIIIKKLVRLFDYDTLIPLVPKSDSRLLTHMRKLSEREKRRKLTRNAKPSENLEYSHMVDSDEEDSDDGRTLITNRTKRSLAASKRQRSSAHTSRSEQKHSRAVLIKNDTEGLSLEVGDLTRKSDGASISDESDAESLIQFDNSGKLLIPGYQYDEDDVKMSDGHRTVEPPASKGARKGDEINTRNQKRKQKLGAQYKARSAGGDVKKKGQKYSPYAYVPLDGRSYSKKHRQQAVDQMSDVVERRKKRQKR